MMAKRKIPKIKIPSNILKREAEKRAKVILQKEKIKEARVQNKAKTKLAAKKRAEKIAAREDAHSGYLDDHLKQEIYGGLYIASAITLTAIFFSETITTEMIQGWFRNLFGIGHWGIPLLLAGIGMDKIRNRHTHGYPPVQVVGMFFFVCTLLGLINLGADQSESLAQADRFGGQVGFTVGYFLRVGLGDFVTGVMLTTFLWLSAMLTFRFRLSSLFAPREALETIVNDKKLTKKQAKAAKEAVAAAEPEAPQKKAELGPLQIIDSTRGNENTAKPETQSVDLEDDDAMTQAKNRALSGVWEPPSLDLLKDSVSTISVDEAKLRQSAEMIRDKFEQFGIAVQMKSVHVGPTVTQFTLEPAPGVKLTKITALKNDLALALASSSVRIEAPIRGKSLVGIEIPNDDRATVGMKEILLSDAWKNMDKPLKIVLGRDVAGKPVVADLARMPHLLIAGKTGSGKSVGMNSFLCSLLWNNSPDELKLILIDPKRVELSVYNNLPHLLTQVIVEPEKSVSALAWAVAEMNSRYKKFAKARCRNIGEYNEKNPDAKEPFIVIVIDELADLMMVAGKDVEAAICRIAQMARAVGMHLMIATQRPSVDVVTGLIKANLPARMAFRVSSSIDSRTIIDQGGAEDLLGFGDMLNLDGNSGDLTRIQGVYISNEEIERITNSIKLQFPEMVASDRIQEEIMNQSIKGMAKGGVLTASVGQVLDDSDLDILYEDAVQVVMDSNKASASYLQRRLQIGYARAARILDQMEKRKLIGPSKGAKPRDIYNNRG
jgi:DNA segregation ATPase FtsK/SpoIIIE-like protein